MSSISKNRYVFLFTLLLVTFGLLSCQVRTDALGPGSGSEAPQFMLPDMDGKPFFLSDAKGKVIILNFWSLGCDPCKAEMPDFQSLYEKYGDKGLVIIGVNLDPGAEKYVKSFMKTNGLTFPILKANNEMVGKYGGIHYIPKTVIIDRNGHIIKSFEGGRDEAFFEAIIKDLL